MMIDMIEEIEDMEWADEESSEQLYEHLRMEVDRGQVPVRIDKYMSEHVQHSSRNRIQKAADCTEQIGHSNSPVRNCKPA